MRVLGPQNLRQVLPFACHWHCGLDHPSLALEGWSVGIVVLAWTLDPDVLLPTDSRRRGGLVSVRLESHRGLESSPSPPGGNQVLVSCVC